MHIHKLVAVYCSSLHEYPIGFRVERFTLEYFVANLINISIWCSLKRIVSWHVTCCWPTRIYTGVTLPRKSVMWFHACVSVAAVAVLALITSATRFPHKL